MAKRIIPDYYSFNPATKTITIPNRIIPRQNMLLITNEQTNTVIFNFSDPDLYITSYTAPYSSTATSIGTQFTLNYNTASMGTSDTLAILVDENAEFFTPSEVLVDDTNKLRTSSPQALMDTDFEFGLQPIKWEAYTQQHNYPSYYLKGGGNALNVVRLYADNSSPRSTATIITATTSPHGLVTGDLVQVVFSGDYRLNGVFPVLSIPSSGAITFLAKGQVSGDQLSSYTIINGGTVFDSNNQTSKIALSSNATMSYLDTVTAGAGTGQTIIVNTAYKHGLMPGAPLLVNSSLTNSANGVWFVYDVPSPTQFRYQTPGFASGSSSVIIDTANVVVTLRPEATYTHRSTDGGVNVSIQNIYTGIQAIRQTRRYFRYQSGKGIQMSTGTKFAPSYEIQGVSSVGTTAVITTSQAANLLSGSVIRVEGVRVNAGTTNYYNGDFIVQDVFYSSNIVTYTMSGTPADKLPGSDPTPYMTVKNWVGSSMRVGMFDSQNGFFFEYDGQNWYAVRRSSVREVFGLVNVTNGSGIITGSTIGTVAPTRFSKQLIPGQYVVIRGQSYLIQAIDSDSQIQVTPAYRGPTLNNTRMNMTQDLRVPQSAWNLDRCDGTGPTGFNLDVTKMQMIYMDYTWYGAGFIRWGFRGVDGNVFYCHKMANSNVNNLAYMRSGNLPARYEGANVGPVTQLAGNNTTSVGGTFLAAQTDTLLVQDAIRFPSSGQVVLSQLTSTEVLAYTGKTSATIGGVLYHALTGLTRRQLGGTTSNMTFFPTEYFGGTAGFSSVCAVQYLTCNAAPTFMHWGSSVIMDGGFQDDNSIQFAYVKQTSAITLQAGTSIAAISIRLSPSVDNGTVGAYGVKDVVNRMQLRTRSLGIATNTSIQVLGVLNGTFPANTSTSPRPVLPGDWATTSIVANIGVASLAQIIDHTGNGTLLSGGEQIFGFVTGNTADNYDISVVRDLGTSIVSGDGSNKTPGFPVGPDVLTIVLKNANPSVAIASNVRLSWTEAQA